MLCFSVELKRSCYDMNCPALAGGWTKDRSVCLNLSGHAEYLVGAFQTE